jgi:KDO2-lipid IV(A) lauroyltransferase
MAKSTTHLLDYTVYLLVRIVVCLVQSLSWPWALWAASALAALAFRVDRRHRLVAAENLRHAFPRLGDGECDALVRATYRHFAIMLVEMIRLPRTLRPANIDYYIRYADPQDRERLLAWGRSGRPLLLLTGHFGNWEILSYAFGLAGYRGGIVARRLDNRYLDRFLAVFRSKTGQTLLDKNLDYAQILKALARGGGLGMVGDQDAGPRGLFLSFFGRPASTFKSIPLLSLEYGAQILVLGAARTGHPMRYRIYLEEAILPEHHAHRPGASYEIARRFTQALERMVLRHPEQYFWLHRRWKSQPPARKACKAA